MEAVLKYLVNVKARIGSYSIDISEKCLSANNNFNGGIAIVGTYRTEEGFNIIILATVSPNAW